MKPLIGRFIPLLFILGVVAFFFWPFFTELLLPIPTDNIVGMFHPFQDYIRSTYPRGVPFKNYLISDPIKQQYPWRSLVISQEKKFQLPLWNPYTFAGAPLLANVQSSAFYFLNILFFIFPFYISWSILIFLEPLLAAIFLFLYLDNLKLSKYASVLGGISFAFSGFFISWLEWGTVLHVGLWLPLILLCVDKICLVQRTKIRSKKLIWPILFIFSLASSFFAGHLQIFFYVFLISWAYILFRNYEYRNKKNLLLFLLLYFVVLFIISVQLIPTIQLILLSARNIDQANWRQNSGWFVPWQHGIQFLAPDFFGNPATRNYSSIFNYGEFVGYIGIIPLLMAIFAVIYRKERIVKFFICCLVSAIIFAFPSGISNVPYILQIPFFSTSQPTRLMFVIDFSLAILAGFGFDYFIFQRKKIKIPILVFLLTFLSIWIFVLTGKKFLPNPDVSQRNLYFPTLLFIITFTVFILDTYLKNKKQIALILLLIITVFDLNRFANKYTVFSEKNFLFPQTKTISFLQQQKGLFRIMTTDEPVLPPNFSVMFGIQSLDGYDPLYLKRYAELIAAFERNEPNTKEPFGFNKIVSPHNINSKLLDFLGVKYVLSRIDIRSEKLQKVFEEGKTRVYKNPFAFEKVFFVDNVICLQNKEEVIKEMLLSNLHTKAFVENNNNCLGFKQDYSLGNANISYYSENKIIIKTQNSKEGFLVLVDSFYPTWHAKINNNQTKIYLTDFNFRGIIVPKGENTIEFYNTLL